MSGIRSTIERIALATLSRLDPELAHDAGLAGLGLMNRLWPMGGASPPALPQSKVHCLGLQFSHAVGLAAGFDKNGDALDALGALGFSHVELGTVTPRPQVGNPKPRMFRIRGSMALVNRMGFNNQGVDHLVGRLAVSRYTGIRGVSIGKNAYTPLEEAHQDYLACFDKVYVHANYVAINISSPNTARLRELQDRDGLERIVGGLLERRVTLEKQHTKRVPLLVKVAPDLDADQIGALARHLKSLGVDGVIATNTSVNWRGLGLEIPGPPQGGISGAPLHPLSISVISRLRAELGADFPIVGVGGIVDAATALESLRAGANLIQIYTGFAYRGTQLLNEIVAAVDGRKALDTTEVS
jgi:dihydroorotate dehydrogenase